MLPKEQWFHLARKLDWEYSYVSPQDNTALLSADELEGFFKNYQA